MWKRSVPLDSATPELLASRCARHGTWGSGTVHPHWNSQVLRLLQRFCGFLAISQGQVWLWRSAGGCRRPRALRWSAELVGGSVSCLADPCRIGRLHAQHSGALGGSGRRTSHCGPPGFFQGGAHVLSRPACALPRAPCFVAHSAVDAFAGAPGIPRPSAVGGTANDSEGLLRAELPQAAPVDLGEAASRRGNDGGFERLVGVQD